MHGVADLGRVQAAVSLAAPAAHGSGLHPGDALGVVAVRAALEERERAVREPRDAVERRLGDDGELAQARRGRRQRLARALEQRELARLGDGTPRARAVTARPAGVRLSAVDPQDDRGRAALDLDRPVGRPSRASLVEPEPAEHPADRRLVARRRPAAPIEPETISRSIARVIAT